MQTQKAIKNRYSCRKFLPKAIPKKYIEKLIEAARYAPSARNIQPWEFVVVNDKEKINKIAILTKENAGFLAESPCCIAVFCRDTKYYLEDGCAATENILLCATDLGLGSCWIAGDKKEYAEKVKKLLEVPEDFKLVSLIALGYPKEKKIIKNKRPLKEIIHWNKF